MNKAIVQSLWIGGRLSTMERLSILSYLEQGHPFHLYVYGPVANIPDGTIVRSGQEILPSEEIFCYQHGYRQRELCGVCQLLSLQAASGPRRLVERFGHRLYAALGFSGRSCRWL